MLYQAKLLVCRVGRTNFTQTIKKLYENFTADLGISTSGCLPQQKITLEIDIVVSAYENKADTLKRDIWY